LPNLRNGGKRLTTLMAGRTTRFLSMVVMARWCGPGGGDGREDDAVLRCGGDGRVVWTYDGDDGGRGQEGGSVVPTTEEERDGAVPGCGSEGRADGAVPGLGDSVEVVRVAAVSKRAREILAA
jgi:hypothetical protein